MTQIISIANSKGGCGKTTTTIHLADYLASKKLNVLLVDFDPQGHSTMGFVNTPEKIKYNIADALLSESNAINLKTISIKINDYLTLLPSGISLSSLEQKLHAKKNREYYLRENLKEIASDYDIILIDCPPQLGLLSINAFITSQKAIVPVDSSIFALKGVEQSLDIFNLISKKLKHEIEYKILLTHYIPQTQFCQDLMKEIEKKYSRQLFENKIGYSLLFKQAIEERKLVREISSRSQAAQHYKKFGDEFLTWIEDELQTDQINALKEGSSAFGKGIQLSRNKVDFTFYGLKNTEVQIVGDFNNWMPDQDILKYDSKKKLWKTSLKLPRGSYQYQYVVDGKLIPDPENPEKEKQNTGEVYSVFEIE